MFFRMNNIFAAFPFLITAILAHSARALGEEKHCVDFDPNCANWIIEDREGNICARSTFVAQKCRQSCPQHCPPSSIFANYDESRVPDNLKPISWLLGVWRSEHDGKAMFPTIPKFTYGEEISISLSDAHLNSEPAFNYTAFAWSSHDKDELHSENGFITVYSGTTRVALTTVMNNGFVTVEEGPVSNFRIRFKLVDIGRISFSRDLPVHDLVREWTLIDGHHLESRLDMETLTHGMREHTVITYTKIFP